jgi:mono/diheme cytochrome c family protein
MTERSPGSTSPAVRAPRAWLLLAAALAAGGAGCVVEPTWPALPDGGFVPPPVVPPDAGLPALPDAGPDGGVLPPGPDAGTRYTWARDVAPIVAQHCQVCHGPEPAFGAPFPIAGYGDTQRFVTTGPAGALARLHERMAARVGAAVDRMPPMSRPALSAFEVEVIRDWSAGGAPLGVEAFDAGIEPDGGELPGADAGPGVPWANGGAGSPPVGEPGLLWLDTFASTPARDAFEPPARESNQVCFSFRVGTATTATAHAIALEPVVDDAAHVARMVVHLDDSGRNTSPAMTGPFACPGGPFEPMGSSGAPEPAEYLGSWAPGLGYQPLPEGTGIPLRPQDRVVLQVQYVRVPRAGLRDMSGIRLLLDTRRAATPVATLWAGVRWTAPLEGPEVQRQGGCVLPADVTLLQAVPRMGLFGRRMVAEVQRAGDGVWEPVFDVEPWDPAGVAAQPVPGELQLLRAGDRLRTTCTWDTMGLSVRNGEGIADEVCQAFFLHTPPLAMRGPTGACMSAVP